MVVLVVGHSYVYIRNYDCKGAALELLGHSTKSYAISTISSQHTMQDLGISFAQVMQTLASKVLWCKSLFSRRDDNRGNIKEIKCSYIRLRLGHGLVQPLKWPMFQIFTINNVSLNEGNILSRIECCFEGLNIGKVLLLRISSSLSSQIVSYLLVPWRPADGVIYESILKLVFTKAVQCHVLGELLLY